MQTAIRQVQYCLIHTDPRYEDVDKPALLEVFSHPVASGLIEDFDELDYVVQQIHGCLAA